MTRIVSLILINKIKKKKEKKRMALIEMILGIIVIIVIIKIFIKFFCKQLPSICEIFNKCGIDPICVTKQLYKNVTKGFTTVAKDVKKLF